MNALLLINLVICLSAKPNLPVCPFAISVYPVSNSTRLHVNVDKIAGLPLQVRLVTARQETLYEKWVGRRQQRYRGLLNLDNLPEGTYYLSVSGGPYTLTRTVFVDQPYAVPVQSTRTVTLSQD
ncbi:MAG: hypothetical protein H7Z72_16550 [Bacteroidetes bacterium]|nr:hypothetical protein [Fibrella sp.]